MTREPQGEHSGEGDGSPDSRQHNKPLLADLFWRDEILQVMYWYRGEGFGDTVSAKDLRTFLNVDEQSLVAHLGRMVVEGYLVQVVEAGDAGGEDIASGAAGPRYSFTDFGAKEGARRFADEFSDITKQAHGDCPPDCPICKDLPPEDCVHCHSISQEA